MNEQPKVPEALINPAAQSYMNSAISSAVSEAVKSIFENLAPMMKEMALTPEKIKALQTKLPSEEEKKRKDRDERESAKSKADEAQLRLATAKFRANCSHRYPNSTEAINLIHNYPDRQTRGICVLCGDIISPREWIIEAPDKDGRENAKIRDQHKDYLRVIAIENART